MDAQLTVLQDAVELRLLTLDEAARKVEDPESKNVRRAFINRHAWNILDLALDVLRLGRGSSLGSIYLLSRPALESLFKLAAAVTDERFAAEKLVAEVEEEQAKLKKWRGAAGADWVPTLDAMITGLEEYGIELRQRYEVTSQQKWNIFEVAKLGQLEAEYVREYFIGSKHVHAMLSALTDRENCLYVSRAL